MQRDMSYELDDVFADRNAGELVLTEQRKTKVLRTPGLRDLSLPLAQSLPSPTSQSLALPLARESDDLAGDINLPGIGPVSVQKLAIGAAVGLGIWYFLLRRH
jgi:hypothetical protein